MVRDLDRLRETLGPPELRWLVERVRERFELGHGSEGSVSLGNPTSAQREAFDRFLGRRGSTGARLQVSLERIEQTLRQAELTDTLTEAIEAIGGPLVDRRSLREEALRAREAMWRAAREHRSVAGRPEIRIWLDELESRGLLRRAANTHGLDESSLLEDASTIAARLPAKGIQLSVLAADTTGDAHALDAGKPLTTLVLRAAAHLAGWEMVPASANARRRLWSEVGVLCDPLSCHVLVLGLEPLGDDLLARHLREASQAGEPRKVTLRELTRSSLSFSGSDVVKVCENATVAAAAADRLGPRCAPLVCTEGVPSSAVMLLLETIVRHGARVRFHCDFDWGGIRIGNHLVDSVGAQPWRFDALRYRAAIETGLEGKTLTGDRTTARWSPELSETLAEVGTAIYEESLVEELLDDLTL